MLLTVFRGRGEEGCELARGVWQVVTLLVVSLLDVSMLVVTLITG